MFHIHLKKRRLMCGLSQKQIADFLNITPQSVSKWENGDALPSIEYLPKLAECLECDINSFFAPIQENELDNTVMYSFLALMNEMIYHETKTTEDVQAFVQKNPSIIDITIAFCRNLMERKTLHSKLLQKMIGCSDAETHSIIKLLSEGEMLEKLDIDGTYLIVKEAVNAFIILLKLQKTIYEKSCQNDDTDFISAFMRQIDNE